MFRTITQCIGTIFDFISSRHTYRSQFNGKVEVVTSFGKKILYANDVAQSGGEYIPMWESALKSIETTYISNCLLLGVGGGTAIDVIQKKFPESSITGIEIDPVIIGIAKKQFRHAESPCLHLIQADALEWIMPKKSETKYDLIVVDIFLGIVNPQLSREILFLDNIKRLLNSNGTVIYNAHFQPQRPESYRQLQQLCKKLFNNTKEIFHYRYNRILQMQI